ncbi:MAG: CAP domain-containing protein [Salibacteraceae bacterium]
MKILFNILFILATICSYGQINSKSNVNINIDIELLEQLVFEEINSFRVKNKIPILLPDSILYEASKNHASYLSRKEKLTHYQKEHKSLKDPQLRIEFFGAHDFKSGENILAFPFGVPVKLENGKVIEPKTYEEYAKELALTWWNSKPHKANILTADFRLSAISIHFNNLDSTLYGVQVFGSPFGEYEYVFSEKTFPYSTIPDEKKKKSFEPIEIAFIDKYQYGLKSPEKFSDCPPSLKRKWHSVEGSLTITRDKMLLCIYDLREFSALFKNKKDGLSVELISFENQYQCSGLTEETASLRNGMSLFDGVLYKPIYRNEILKQVEELQEKARKQKKKQGERSCNYIVLGDTPEGFSNYPYQAKLHFVRDKKLCNQIQFNLYCGELLVYSPNNIQLKYSTDCKPYVPLSKEMLLDFTVAFEQNSTSFNSADLQQVIDQLKDKEYVVKEISIDAFASVEGTQANNEALFNKRAEVLVKALEANQNGRIKYQLKSRENWELFYDQIDTTEFYQMKVWEKSRIKEWLSDPSNAKYMTDFLNDQRKAIITMTILPIQNLKWKQLLAESEWNRLIAKPNKENVDFEQLEIIQCYLQNMSNEGSSIVDPKTLNVPVERDYLLLAYRAKMFNVINGSVYDPNVMVEWLKAVNKKLHLREADYNIKAIIANHSSEFKSKEKIHLIRSLITELKLQKTEKALVQDLELWYHIEMANLAYNAHKSDFALKSEVSLKHIKRNYLRNDSTVERRLELANFFIAFEKFEWAKELLLPLVNQEKPNKAAFKLYLSHCLQYEMENFPSTYAAEVVRAYDVFNEKEWCRLFIGPCKISINALSWPSLKSLYCESCSSLIQSKAD